VAEEPSGTTGGKSPGLNVGRVTPHKITEGAFVRDFKSAFEEADLVEGLNIRGKATVDAENFAFNDSADAKMIKNVNTVLPRVGISVLTHIFIVKTVDGGNLPSFVISAKEGDVARVTELEHHQELEGFDGVVATVDKIAHKDVAGVGNTASLFEELDKVMELTVDVTADGDGSGNRLNVGLFIRISLTRSQTRRRSRSGKHLPS
jgi:hypothetical protein